MKYGAGDIIKKNGNIYLFLDKYYIQIHNKGQEKFINDHKQTLYIKITKNPIIENNTIRIDEHSYFFFHSKFSNPEQIVRNNMNDYNQINVQFQDMDLVAIKRDDLYKNKDVTLLRRLDKSNFLEVFKVLREPNVISVNFTYQNDLKKYTSDIYLFDKIICCFEFNEYEIDRILNTLFSIINSKNEIKYKISRNEIVISAPDNFEIGCNGFSESHIIYLNDILHKMVMNNLSFNKLL